MNRGRALGLTWPRGGAVPSLSNVSITAMFRNVNPTAEYPSLSIAAVATRTSIATPDNAAKMVLDDLCGGWHWRNMIQQNTKSKNIRRGAATVAALAMAGGALAMSVAPA